MSRPEPLSDVEGEHREGGATGGRTPAVAGPAPGRRWVSRPAAAKGFKAPPPPPQASQGAQRLPGAPEGGGSAPAAPDAPSAKTPALAGARVVSLADSGQTPAVAGGPCAPAPETDASSQGTADTPSGCDGDVSSSVATTPRFTRAPSLGLPALGLPPPPPPVPGSPSDATRGVGPPPPPPADAVRAEAP
ncbi:MAG: hypothetical protein GY772_13660, partial [bacterium]|nr:hypothetical protein [bacterium]